MLRSPSLTMQDAKNGKPRTFDRKFLFMTLRCRGTRRWIVGYRPARIPCRPACRGHFVTARREEPMLAILALLIVGSYLLPLIARVVGRGAANRT